MICFIALISCDNLNKAKEFLFNRYKITSPSMSPTLVSGESYVAYTANEFKANQIVVYRPPVEYRFNNDKVVWAHRLVGLPGDFLEMRLGKLFTNGAPYPFKLNLKQSYIVRVSMPLNTKRMERFEYAPAAADEYRFNCTPDEIMEVKKNKAVTGVSKGIFQPNDETGEKLNIVGKNRDNWGPFKIPRKGDHVLLTHENIVLYEPIIKDYGLVNKLNVGDTLKFTKNYFFVLGDNRHNALDSRYLGLIPDDAMQAVLDVN
jgi:signal peptidase I